MLVRVASLVPLALAVLALATPARADLAVGANDSAASDPSQASWLFPTAAAEGLQEVALTLRWDERSPTLVPNQAGVDHAISLAAANGLSLVLNLYPLHSQVFTGGAPCAPSSDPEACGDTARIQQFAAWTGLVAKAFSSVHAFVVMNECNQPLYVNPQWDSSGQNQSAEICGRALAASYDVLKGIDPQNVVWGVGLSPRGNDDPAAPSNSSTSPVMFLQALGAWFRAFVAKTGRTTPLMDGFDFHAYPVPQSLPFAQGYASAVDASVANLTRVYQAFYTAFEGTPQPTIGQQSGGGLPVRLGEVGIQTTTAGHGGYVGTETSGTAAGGVLGDTATEAYQSGWYQQMLDLLACDPNVHAVDIFPVLDEPSLAGWQSGLYYVDHTPKLSAQTVHDWIATSGGRCQGTLQPWTAAGVPAAPAGPTSPTVTTSPRIVAAVAGRVRIFDAATHALVRVLAPFGDAYTGPLAAAVGPTRIAVATGAGAVPRVALLDRATGTTLASWAPFARSSRGGLSVAFGALGVVVGSGPGAPAQVKVYDAKTHALVETLSPFGRAFRGGVSVAVADVTGGGGGGGDDLVVGSGAGMRSTVAIFSGTAPRRLATLTPFAAAFHGGVTVAAGDLTGSRRAEIVVGSGPGIPAVVNVYSGATRRRLWSLTPYASTFTGGAAVAVDGRGDLVVGPGAGGSCQVKAWNGRTHAVVASFLAAPGSAAVSVAAG